MSTVFFLNGDSVADSSKNAVAITNTGVVVSTAQSRFGGSSLYFNGSANITFCLPEDCFAGTHDWTVDWWEYRLGAKTSSAVFCRPITASASSGLILCDDNGQGGLGMYESSAGSSHNVASGVKIGTRTLNAWVHRAVVKKNGVYTAYENGVKVTSVTYTGSIATSTTPMRIGNYGTSMFYGYIDEFRISDVAKWSEDFNPTVIGDIDESEITGLEYIKSAGAQYCKTGVIPTQNTRILLDVQVLSSQTSACWLFGSRESSKAHFWVQMLAGGQFNTSYATVGDKAFPTSVSPYSRNVIDKNSNVTTISGQTVTHTAGTLNSSLEMFLFVENYNGTATSFTKMKLYGSQIFEAGFLVRDYIPAKMSSGEVGLYDRVFKEFYRNAGTGAFAAGPEMAHEDYTELEYIQSDGRQYMDTRFYPTGATKVSLDFQIVNQGTEQQGVFGSRPGSTGRFTVFTGTSPARLQVDYNTQFGLADSEVDISGLNLNERTLLEVSNTLAVNRARVRSVSTASFTSAYTLFLFANNNAGTAQLPGAVVLYACQISDSGTNIRNYIPMLHPSGVPGLWDSVNERFYASATTTDLIAGPVAVKAPKAPANFRVVSEADTKVVLAWDADKNAVGYRLYRDGALLADLAGTEYTDTATPFSSYTYQVRGYNEHGEGDAAERVVFISPDNPILWLVTDRTQEDVSARNAKGSYRAVDLNRVGYAVRYLADALREHGITVGVNPRADWSDGAWVTPAAARTYLADIQTLRGALSLVKSTPDAPLDLEKLTFEEANRIETILLVLDGHIRNMIAVVDAGWVSGLAYTGFYAKEANG